MPKVSAAKSMLTENWSQLLELAMMPGKFHGPELPVAPVDIVVTSVADLQTDAPGRIRERHDELIAGRNAWWIGWIGTESEARSNYVACYGSGRDAAEIKGVKLVIVLDRSTHGPSRQWRFIAEGECAGARYPGL